MDEDNAIETIGQILMDNGWTYEKTFYKAVCDTRAYYMLGGNEQRVNYAFAKHVIYRNADGKYLGIANTAAYSIFKRLTFGETIRRPYDDLDEEDDNFGMTPSWEEWARQKYADMAKNTSIYFYMLEKVPSDEKVPEGALISTVVMPGMSETRLQVYKDRDTNYKRLYWNPFYRVGVLNSIDLDNNEDDLVFKGKVLSASEEYVLNAALDIEVMETEWIEKEKEVRIVYAEPRIMQSPYAQVQFRPSSVEYTNNPVYYTNWWTDSVIRLKGYVDSKTINVILQADSAPMYSGNVVPTIPLYFGRIIPIEATEEDAEPGYALFGGSVPPITSLGDKLKKGASIMSDISPDTTDVPVDDLDALPTTGNRVIVNKIEYARIVAKADNVVTLERWVGVVGKEHLQDEELEAAIQEAKKTHKEGTKIKALDSYIALLGDKDPLAPISTYDFDNPSARMGDVAMPILKVYNRFPSNGIDNVMCSKTRYGARYQSHYLSYGAQPNTMPPDRELNLKKYPNAYNSLEKSTNYKYQFNTSKYSDKVHATPVYVVHPEDGVRGMLEYCIGFNSQSVSNSGLKVRTADCPEEEYDKYIPNVVGAVSPLTKRPSVVYRPMGYGIFKEHVSPALEAYDPTTDDTPPSPVNITMAKSNQVGTAFVAWEPPTDFDFAGVNIYVDGELHISNVVGINHYLIGGLPQGMLSTIEIEAVDLAGNVSEKVATEPINIL